MLSERGDELIDLVKTNVVNGAEPGDHRHLGHRARKGVQVMDLKLEVVVVPVTDVDKAEYFYGTGLA